MVAQLWIDKTGKLYTRPPVGAVVSPVRQMEDEISERYNVGCYGPYGFEIIRGNQAAMNSTYWRPTHFKRISNQPERDARFHNWVDAVCWAINHPAPPVA